MSEDIIIAEFQEQSDTIALFLDELGARRLMDILGELLDQKRPDDVDFIDYIPVGGKLTPLQKRLKLTTERVDRTEKWRPATHLKVVFFGA